jgi:hypothetical protein
LIAPSQSGIGRLIAVSFIDTLFLISSESSSNKLYSLYGENISDFIFSLTKLLYAFDMSRDSMV